MGDDGLVGFASRQVAKVEGDEAHRVRREKGGEARVASVFHAAPRELLRREGVCQALARCFHSSELQVESKELATAGRKRKPCELQGVVTASCSGVHNDVARANS